MKQAQPRPLDKTLLRLLLLRLFLPSLVVTLLAVGMTGYVVGRNVGTRQLQLARSLAHTVDDYLEHASRILSAVARVAETATPEELASYMQATWQAYGHFDTLYRLDRSGIVTLLAPPDPRYQGLDMSHQLDFQQVRTQTGVTISQPFASPRTGQPAVYVTWPLADGGLVVGELNLGELQETIAAGRAEPGQYTIFVTDRSGTLLAHPQPDLVAQQANVGDMEIVQHGLTNEATMLYATDGTFVLGSATQVEHTGWVVVAQTPLLVAYSPYLGSVGLALVLAPIVWLAMILDFRQQLERHVVAPLARLSQGADALAAGEFAQGAALAATPATFAEVGTLAANFERMSQAIQSRQAALQASEERLRRKTSQQEQLLETAHHLTGSLDSKKVLTRIGTGAKEILEAHGCAIYLLEPDGKTLTPVIAIEPPHEKMILSTPLNVEASFTGQAVKARHGLVFNDAPTDVSGQQIPGTPVEAEERIIAAPFVVDDKVLGAMCLNRIGARFSDEDLALAETFATYAAAALKNAQAHDGLQREVEERKRAEEEIRRRTAQLEALRQVGLELTAQLDLDTLLHSIVSQAVELLGGNSGGLYLHRPDQDVLEWTVKTGPHLASIGSTLHRGEGLSGKVWETGEPLIVDDYQHWEGRAAAYKNYPFAAVVGVPVRWGDDFLGVINVLADRPHTFSPADAELLSLFATQAAIAIRNVRLFAEIKRSAQHIQALYETSRALSSSLEEEPLMRAILEAAYRTLGCEHVIVSTVDEEAGTIGDRHGIWHGQFDLFPEWVQMAQYSLDHPDIVADVYRTGRTEIIVGWDERLNREIWDKFGPERFQRLLRIFMPIKMRDRVIGVVEVGYDKREQDHVTEEEMQMLAAFTDQAAVALENARLFEQEREQRELAEALEEAAAAVSSTLHPDQVLDHILEQVERIVTGDDFNVMLIEGDTARMVRWRGYERVNVKILGTAFPIAEYPSLVKMMQTRKPVVISDTATDPDWPLQEGWEWMRSYVAAPIRVGSKMMGFLSVDGTRPGQFGPADTQRLEAFANHAATAIENAGLFGEAQQRVAELEALQRTSLQLTSSLDLSAVLDTIAASALTLVGASDCHIYLYDEATETFAFGTALWKDGRREAAVQTLRPDGLTATVARRAHPIIINDAPHHPLYTTPEAQKWRMRAIAGFPLKRAGRVLGVFTIAFLEPHTFSQEELRVLGLLADQAAIAIENAQLYRQLSDHAEQLEQRVQERTAQLQAQYAHLDAILRSASDGIVAANAEGEIIQTNPVAHTWLTQTLSPGDAARLRAEVQYLAQRAAERPETVLELTGLDLELKAAPISEPKITLPPASREAEGVEEAAAAVVAVHDVSHLKALERMKTRFVSNVSHELRTPVTTIKLYAALMHRRPEKWKEYLGPLTQEADRQVQLVQDILQISRIDTGRLALKPRPTSLNRLTEEITASHQMLARERGLILEHRPAEPATSAGSVEPPVALIDPERVKQVLNNLVENAIHYTPEGGKVVTSTGKEEWQGRVWAIATVTDTGMGIPEEELPHVFERFFRGEKPRLMQISGTGLGLAIAREIVELHGGQITVESEAEVGTTFTVWLPLTDAQG